MPDLARGTWKAIRDKFVDFDGRSVRLRGSSRARVDLGNYNVVNGDGMTRVFVATAAAEMGETDLAAALILQRRLAVGAGRSVVWCWIVLWPSWIR